MNGQRSMLGMVDRINEQKYREKLSGWNRPKFNEPAGLVVICEQKLTRDNENQTHFYRAVLGYHRTVGGMEAHIVSVPNEEWPDVPPWGKAHGTDMRWIYPQGSMMRFYAGGETQDPVWTED